MTTNVHEKHVGAAAYQYGIQCQVCHNTVVNGTPAITSTALHVNNANNAAFAANEGTYTGGVAPAGGTCTVTYCHSQGLDWTGPYASVNNAAKITADWDLAAGSLGCYGCHGDGSALAYPTYANDTPVNAGAGNQLKKNSHPAHASYTCNNCHSATVDAANNIIALNLHTNKAWNLAQGGTATFTISVQGLMSAGNIYTPTTCTDISCHGGAGTTAQWGASLGCDACHFSATADTNDYVYDNGTVAKVRSTGEWDTAGHGRTAGSYDSGNGAAKTGGKFAACTTACHSATVPHNTANNPFRLRTNGGVVDFSDAADPQADNTVCLDCHSATGALSAQATTHVEQNHYGGKHTAQTMGGSFCWDCHDPHGDTYGYMVHSGHGGDAGATA